MLNILSAFIFCLSSNIDIFFIAVNFGTKKINISISNILIIASITTFITYISMYMAKFICVVLSFELGEIIGAISLIFIGAFQGIQYIYEEKRTKSNKKNDDNKSESNIQNIDIKNIVFLSIILSINNLAVGIAASITGINIYISCFFTFILTYFFILIGIKFGKKLSNNLLKSYIFLISNMFLVLIGILQIIF